MFLLSIVFLLFFIRCFYFLPCKNTSTPLGSMGALARHERKEQRRRDRKREKYKTITQSSALNKTVRDLWIKCKKAAFELGDREISTAQAKQALVEAKEVVATSFALQKTSSLKIYEERVKGSQTFLIECRNRFHDLLAELTPVSKNRFETAINISDGNREQDRRTSTSNDWFEQED